jgi:molybdate transport system substrate-binding protein
VKRWYLFLLVAALTGLSGCAIADRPAITVGAASSLQPLLESMRSNFEEEAGITLLISYSASGIIARQIEEGAPIDVFVSAGRNYIDDLTINSFLRNDSISTIAYGHLKLVRSNLPGNEELGFAGAQRIAIANPSIAPYGAAAQQLLMSSGKWEDVQPRLVIAESALQAYQFVKAGEVDYAFVPLPLIRISSSDVVDGDSESAGLGAMPSISYVAAVTIWTTQENHARTFINYLRSSKVKMTEYGYDTALGVP